MNKIRLLLKRAFTPVTIMIIPHNGLRSLNIKIPVIEIFFTLLLTALGTFYIFSLAANGRQYPSLVEKVDFYTKEFAQWNSTASALKEVESEFRKIFSLKSKEKILETIDISNSGSINIENLMQELQKTADNVNEIRDYLRIQKGIYRTIPKGYPVNGTVTSPYGKREDPFDNNVSFHSGIDISASPRTPIRATADGVVSYSGWTEHSGNVVVLEHGSGFSTVYAHNNKNAVKVSQKVKRGDIIGYVGSTGKSTGPHVHYEVWEKHKNVNPKKFLEGKS